MNSDLREYDLAKFIAAEDRHLFKNCSLLAAPEAVKKLTLAAPTPGTRNDQRVELTQSDFRGHIRIALGPGSGSIRVDSKGPINVDIRTWRSFNIVIGAGTTISSARIVCDEADLLVGEGGMWSDEVLVQANDQHGIVDLTTMTLINGGRRRIEIGEHVWLGRRTTIMPDVSIGTGSILATGAVLTGNMPERTIFGGIPARLVRENATWSRAPAGFSWLEAQRLGISDTVAAMAPGGRRTP